jgi:carboxypeptidase C (cathepsin A)
MVAYVPSPLGQRDRVRGATLCALLALLLLALPPSFARADEPPPSPAKNAIQLPADATTHHTIALDGKTLDYTAVAGSLPLSDDKGAKQADIFYVAFFREGVSDVSHRPITYAFNGGPGAAAAYLDLGALGPRALDFGAQGKPQPAVDSVQDNPDTWLPFTDLVFIDPVGTGFSRAVNDEAAKKLYRVGPDLDALSQIIRLHLTRTQRLTSPVFLAGESYGGFRAARLAHQLATDAGIAPQGVLLVSPAIEFRLMQGDRYDVLPWALALPSYAAVALEEKNALSADALKDAESFALGEYLTGLAAPDARPAQFYQRIAALTGLAEPIIERWRGRIPAGVYIKERHRDAGEVLSRYDGGIAAPDPNPSSRYAEDDPVLEGTIAPFTRAFTAYARSELGFSTDLAYQLLNHEVSRHWEWRDGEGGGGRGSLGAGDELGRALALEPGLRVLIAHGLTDLTTPYMMSRFVVDHLPRNVTSERVSLKLYAGGHMMYLRTASRHRLHDDAQAFYGGEAP